MKKLCLFIFLGLMICNVGFSKEIKISHKDKNSISLTRSIWSEAEMFEIAAKHCNQYQKYAFTFGIFNKEGVRDNNDKTTRLYHCSKNNLTKSPLTGEDNIHWTNYKISNQIVEKKEKPKKITKEKIVKTDVKSDGVKVKLKCRGILDTIEGDIVYVTFDDHKIEIFQGSGGNKVEFKVKIKNEQYVISHLRSVLKGDTSYDTHVSDWEHWDFVEYKKHLYQIQVDRLEGFVHIMRSVKPYKNGKENYKLENAGEGIGKICKKSGSKF